jgi:hypothetical protein
MAARRLPTMSHGNPTFRPLATDPRSLRGISWDGPTARAVYDASGKPVPLHGAYYLRITLTPAVEHNAKGVAVYHGPKPTALRLPHLKGFALIGDFEGVVSFGAALRDSGRGGQD